MSFEEQTFFHFGKHAGETYIEVYNNDYQYVTWAKSISRPSGPIKQFLKWVKKYEPKRVSKKKNRKKNRNKNKRKRKFSEMNDDMNNNYNNKKNKKKQKQ
eukprot:434548_1